jgi:hypothetical protein
MTALSWSRLLLRVGGGEPLLAFPNDSTIPELALAIVPGGLDRRSGQQAGSA